MARRPYTAAVGGYTVTDLFKRRLATDDPAYIAHNLDMGGDDRYWKHYQYEYRCVCNVKYVKHVKHVRRSTFIACESLQ